MKRLGILLGTLAIIATIMGYLWHDSPHEVHYRTVSVKRGDVQATISATGTIEPEEVVDVGAQVAGRIKTLGLDLRSNTKSIDYGSLVEEGTVLAQIEEDVYAAQVDLARANVQRSESDLLQMQAKLDQSDREWVRSQNLHKMKSLSDSDFDLARANFDSAKAQVAVGQAAISQAKASLHQAEINLAYTTIKSPVKGVILDRRINVGQTVVASLNAPSLFLIAKDLKRLQVWASVNEADIGQIHSGQPVKFTVDAFRGETFEGLVSQIRLNAMMTQNVVTYTVVVTTDNSSGKLLPYLTANVRFELDSRQNVLLVPNAALRFVPKGESIKPRLSQEKMLQHDRFEATKTSDGGTSRTGRLWVTDGDSLRPLEVRMGLSDGIVTEVEADELKEEMAIVIGEIRSESGTASSPFTPKMFGGGSGNRPQ